MNTKLTFLDLCREYFPDWTDEECDMFLWNFTGFPAFWNSDNPEQEIREALEKMREGVV